MKSLTKQEDIEATRKASESATNWFLSIPETKTPWRLISAEFSDGYVHWVDVGGQRRRIVCAASLKFHGFSPEECPLCALTNHLYQEKKRMKNLGDEAKANAFNTRGNELRAKQEVQFKAIRGRRLLVKTKDGKEWLSDWDMEDEESDVKLGILSMSQSQYLGLTAFVGNKATPHIKDGADLVARTLWTMKEKKKGTSGGKYSQVVWEVDEDASDMPDIEIPKELTELNLDENYVVDSEEIRKVYEVASGSALEAPDLDDDVPLESDSAADAEPSADFLDDVGTDDDEVVAGDDFEDDLPELAPPPKKTTSAVSTRPTQAHTSTRSANVGNVAGAKKSGTTRL